MADKDQFNDEYQFADLDAITPDSAHDTPEDEDIVHKLPEDDEQAMSRAQMKRYGLMALGVLVLVILIYKLMGAIFSERQLPVKTKTPLPISMAQRPIPEAGTQLAKPIALPEEPNVDLKIDQKLSSSPHREKRLGSTFISFNQMSAASSSSIKTVTQSFSGGNFKTSVKKPQANWMASFLK